MTTSVIASLAMCLVALQSEPVPPPLPPDPRIATMVAETSFGLSAPATATLVGLPMPTPATPTKWLNMAATIGLETSLAEFSTPVAAACDEFRSELRLQRRRKFQARFDELISATAQSADGATGESTRRLRKSLIADVTVEWRPAAIAEADAWAMAIEKAAIATNQPIQGIEDRVLAAKARLIRESILESLDYGPVVVPQGMRIDLESEIALGDLTISTPDGTAALDEYRSAMMNALARCLSAFAAYQRSAIEAEGDRRIIAKPLQQVLVAKVRGMDAVAASAGVEGARWRKQCWKRLCPTATVVFDSALAVMAISRTGLTPAHGRVLEQLQMDLANAEAVASQAMLSYAPDAWLGHHSPNQQAYQAFRDGMRESVRLSEAAFHAALRALAVLAHEEPSSEALHVNLLVAEAAREFGTLNVDASWSPSVRNPEWPGGFLPVHAVPFLAPESDPRPQQR